MPVVQESVFKKSHCATTFCDRKLPIKHPEQGAFAETEQLGTVHGLVRTYVRCHVVYAREEPPWRQR